MTPKGLQHQFAGRVIFERRRRAQTARPRPRSAPDSRRARERRDDRPLSELRRWKSVMTMSAVRASATKSMQPVRALSRSRLMLRLLTLKASQNGLSCSPFGKLHDRLLRARRLAAGRLDLDHVRAEIGQDPAGHGRGRMAEFEHADAGERARIAFGREQPGADRVMSSWGITKTFAELSGHVLLGHSSRTRIYQASIAARRSAPSIVSGLLTIAGTVPCCWCAFAASSNTRRVITMPLSLTPNRSRVRS